MTKRKDDGTFKKGESGNSGGRPKGAKNKRTQRALELAKKHNCDPFEILLHFANGNWKALGYEAKTYTAVSKDGSVVDDALVITPEMRLQAARDASPYLYPKLRTVEFVPMEGEEGTVTTFKFIQAETKKEK